MVSLPTAFIHSSISSKADFEASLLLPDDERQRMELAAAPAPDEEAVQRAFAQECAASITQHALDLVWQWEEAEAAAEERYVEAQMSPKIELEGLIDGDDLSLAGSMGSRSLTASTFIAWERDDTVMSLKAVQMAPVNPRAPPLPPIPSSPKKVLAADSAGASAVGSAMGSAADDASGAVGSIGDAFISGIIDGMVDGDELSVAGATSVAGTDAAWERVENTVMVMKAQVNPREVETSRPRSLEPSCAAAPHAAPSAAPASGAASIVASVCSSSDVLSAIDPSVACSVDNPSAVDSATGAASRATSAASAAVTECAHGPRASTPTKPEAAALSERIPREPASQGLLQSSERTPLQAEAQQTAQQAEAQQTAQEKAQEINQETATPASLDAESAEVEHVVRAAAAEAAVEAAAAAEADAAGRVAEEAAAARATAAEEAAKANAEKEEAAKTKAQSDEFDAQRQEPTAEPPSVTTGYVIGHAAGLERYRLQSHPDEPTALKVAANYWGCWILFAEEERGVMRELKRGGVGWSHAAIRRHVAKSARLLPLDY